MLRHRDHGERIGQALGGNRRPFERVERDIDLGAVASADFLADKQHRRFIAFAFADHHGAGDIETVERIPHRIDGDLIGHPFVTTSDPFCLFQPFNTSPIYTRRLAAD